MDKFFIKQLIAVFLLLLVNEQVALAQGQEPSVEDFLQASSPNQGQTATPAAAPTVPTTAGSPDTSVSGATAVLPGSATSTTSSPDSPPSPIPTTDPVASTPTSTDSVSPPMNPVPTVTDSTIAPPVPSITASALSSTSTNVPSDVTAAIQQLQASMTASPRQQKNQFSGGGHGPVVSHPLSYEESQRIMLNSAPVLDPPTADEVEAFNVLLKQNMPLTPQQVVRLRQIIDMSQRAAAIPPTVPPKPVSTTIMMNLAPGTTPPAIRLAKGYVTSLVFVDSTGAPWPIASYDIGDPKATNIQWDGKSNILLIQAATAYSNGDLVVRLAGLMTPLTLELVSGQRVVDFRTDVHVSGIGPNSKDLPAGSNLPNSANQLLLSVLDGVAPVGSKPLTVKGGEGQAWLMGDTMFLRTRFTLLSPGWMGKMVSPDGMNAYELQKSSSVLISQYGEPIELKIEGI